MIAAPWALPPWPSTGQFGTMLRHSALRLVAVGLSTILVAACDSPTASDGLLTIATETMSCEAPPAGDVPAGGGHPARTGRTTVPVSGTPFAVAVSPSGVVYVTRVHAASVVRADLPSTTFSEPFPVGDLPSQVRFSPYGNTAYASNQEQIGRAPWRGRVESWVVAGAVVKKKR